VRFGQVRRDPLGRGMVRLGPARITPSEMGVFLYNSF